MGIKYDDMFNELSTVCIKGTQKNGRDSQY